MEINPPVSACVPHPIPPQCAPALPDDKPITFNLFLNWQTYKTPIHPPIYRSPPSIHPPPTPPNPQPKKMKTATLLPLLTTLLLSSTTTVSAHGYLKEIIVDGKSYPGWAPFSDPYITPAPVRYTRAYKDNGPVPDFTTADITCNVGGNVPIANNIPVKAGGTVYACLPAPPRFISPSPMSLSFANRGCTYLSSKFQWDQWGSSHSGPVMTYIARCPSGCASFKGNSGAVWVKIDQMGYDPSKTPPWGSDMLAKQGASWTVTIPKSLANGEYLLRHEILGLHVAGTRMGAQFYPSCAQVTVTGGGSANPSGVALPGAYSPDDKGILVELWRISASAPAYTPPGGPVWVG